MTFDDKMFIARKLKSARKRAGMTQAQLAEMVNVNEQHISRIENAMYVPSLSLFFRLYKILKLNLSDFGINIDENNLSPIKNELLRIIYDADEKALKHYKNILLYINNNFLK